MISKESLRLFANTNVCFELSEGGKNQLLRGTVIGKNEMKSEFVHMCLVEWEKAG